MNALEQKYLALLDAAKRRQLPDLDSIRLCFQALSLASAIDRDRAAAAGTAWAVRRPFRAVVLAGRGQDGLAPNALAGQAGATRATITGLLDGLEREALIERHADSMDRRALTIRLTPRASKSPGRCSSNTAAGSPACLATYPHRSATCSPGC
ncbi:MarR family winged helix-turn-helix transcriptional regulator [Bradyrhizobium betae]